MKAHMERAVNNMLKVLEAYPNLKDWMINWEPEKDKGYMWSNTIEVETLSNLVEPYGDGHSGASFAVCCRLTKERLMETN